MIFSPFHEKFLRALLQANVRFMVVGGYASIYYGVRRNTGDLDILIRPDRENAVRLLQVFHDLALQTDAIEPEEFEKELYLSIGLEPDAIDIMTVTPGLDFDKAYSRVQFLETGNLKIPFVSFDDLITNKQKLNRHGAKGHLDKADVEALLAARGRQP